MTINHQYSIVLWVCDTVKESLQSSPAVSINAQTLAHHKLY